MAIECDKCGKETKVEQAYHKIQHWSRSGILRRCPDCWIKMKKSGFREFVCTYLILALIGIGMVLTNAQNAFGWFLLNLILFYAFLILAALPHESGHAFAAKAVGFRVYYAVIGVGQTVFERSVFGFEFQLKSIPLGGCVLAAPKNTDCYRLKRSVFVLAGPLANLAMAGLLVLLFPAQALNFDFTGGIRIANTFLMANVFCFAWNLWPRMINTARGEVPNDGLHIWKTLFLSKAAIEEAPLSYLLQEGLEYLKTNQIQKAKEWSEKGLEKFPANINLLNLRGMSLLGLKQFSEARDVFRNLLERPDIDLLHRSLFANNLAYVNTLIGGEELIREADKYSKEALECLHFQPSFKGTRGCVLVELEEFEAGIALLKEAMEQTDSRRSKALNACHIAIAERRRGNEEESQKYAAIARSLDADCMLLDRIT
jgi:hypothetical protein